MSETIERIDLRVLEAAATLPKERENWRADPAPNLPPLLGIAQAQVAILIPTALGTLVATAWISLKDAPGYFTKLAALVAFACFVLCEDGFPVQEPLGN